MSVAQIALDYHTNGFFPLPLDGKVCKFKGVTGNKAKNISRANVAKFGDHNLGLRLPNTVVGLDWDAYKGAESFIALIELLGDLPVTYKTTSRTDGQSGIYLYSVPAGTKFVSELSDAHVELIQHTHRYATVFPSIHPDTNRQYNWYFGAPNGDSFEIDIPKVSKLPALPERWIQFLTKVAQIRKTNGALSVGASKLASFSARIEEFANMSAGNRNNVMKDLARDGMWYELGGRLEDGQSFEMILEAAERNGLVSEETLNTVTYRVQYSRQWAEKHFDASKVGNPEGAQFDETAIRNWNNSVQASDLSDDVKFAANVMASFAIEKRYGYIIMSTRLLADFLGTYPMKASRIMKKLSESGWIDLTSGQGINKEGKPQRANEIRFNMTNVTVTEEAPLVGDVAVALDEMIQTIRNNKEISTISPLTSKEVGDIMCEGTAHHGDGLPPF